MAATRCDLVAVFQSQTIFAVKERMNLADALDVDYRRAMNAQKSRWVEFAFERVHRRVKQMRLLARVYSRVVVGGFYPVDFIDAEEQDSLARFDGQPFEILLFFFNVLNQIAQFPVYRFKVAVADSAPGSVNRFAESRAIYGLKQIIERVNFECPQRVLIISRYENDRRHSFRSNLVYYGESAEARHLDIEKDQIGRESLNCLDCPAPVRAFADNLEIHLFAEAHSYALARKRLVIDYQHPDSFHISTRAKRNLRARYKSALTIISELEFSVCAVEIFEPRPRVGKPDAFGKSFFYSWPVVPHFEINFILSPLGANFNESP
jgi:hypothetical protein